MIILGITGTLGAGKGTVVDYLVKNKGFVHYSVRGYLTREIQNRGLELNRDSMVLVANDLRSKHNPAYIIEELYEEAKKVGKNCIIESIRTPGEVQSLKKRENFYLLAVDADPKTRYDRIVLRGSETDHISFEEFIANEKREFTSDDPNKQNLSWCINNADFMLENNEEFEEFFKRIDKILNQIIDE